MTSHDGHEPKDPSSGLDQTLGLLRAKDDTSRFAGLSLLRSLLDSNEKLRRDPEVISKCWSAISEKFLVRLLKAQASDKRSEDESKSLVELAVSIIHIFVNLLPPSELGSAKIRDLCEPISKTISRLDPGTRVSAFQILQSVAACPSNFSLFREQPILASLAALAYEDESSLREYGRLLRLLRNSGLDSNRGEFESRCSYVERMIRDLLEHSTKDNRTLLFEVIADIFRDGPSYYTTDFINSLMPFVQEAILRAPRARTRRATITLISSFIRDPSIGMETQSLAFAPAKGIAQDPDKPFAYIFVNLVLIEIRSAIPSLMENLASPSYPSTAFHLASCFDILSAFIQYLLSSLSAPETPNSPTPTLILPPDTLLKLRRATTDTLSQTLEYLRDRWDAAHAGAAGLPASTKADLRVTRDWRSDGRAAAPLALPWDNPTLSPAADPLVVAGLRTLALWLREDDDPGLIAEARGLLDMLLVLFAGREGGAEGGGETDLRVPVAMVLDAVLRGSEKAVAEFLDMDGWMVLASDLRRCLGSAEESSSHIQDVVRAMLAVVESGAVPASREAWMEIVKFLGERDLSNLKTEQVDDMVAAWQLAVALVIKAPVRLKKNFKRDWERIKENAEKGLSLDGPPGQETREGLREIVDDLGGINV